MQPNKQCTGREQRHEQGESSTTHECYYPQALKQSYLADGATTFIQKQRNGHSQRREWQTGSVDLYNAGPGRPNGSRETVAGYLPPWWSRLAHHRTTRVQVTCNGLVGPVRSPRLHVIKVYGPCLAPLSLRVVFSFEGNKSFSFE